MADETALAQRLVGMRERRTAALYAQARREAALDILEADGAVTTDAVDIRVAATFTPVDSGALDNLMAQEAAAAVAHTAGQVDALQQGADRYDRAVDKARAALAAAEQAKINAVAQVEEARAQNEDAQALAALTTGDAAAAPPSTMFEVAPDPAAAAATANGA